MVEFEGGQASVYAEEGAGFDPTEIPGAIEEAGFGPGEILLEATGELTSWEDLPALKLPGDPGLLILGGGSGIDRLGEADLPAASRIRVEGSMHSSHADKPPGMTVERWELLESASPSDRD